MSDLAITDDAVGKFTIGGDLTARRLGFGAMRISGARNAEGVRDRDTARAIVRRVVDRGVNLIDTANIYGYGESEEIIAEALNPYPDYLVITTKAGYKPGKILKGHVTLPPLGHPDHIREECDKSLRRLRIDVIDLHQVHAPDPNIPFDETIGAFVELQHAGKIRHIGISNVTAEQPRLRPAAVNMLPIPGTSQITHADENLEAAWLTLDDDDLARIDEAAGA